MKKALSLVSLMGLLSFVGCGGGDESTNNVGSLVNQLVALDQQYKAGGVNADEYIIQGANVLAAIDNLPNGPEELTSYLETKAYGGSLPAGEVLVTSMAVGRIGPVAWTVSLPQIYSNVNDAVTYITTSHAYEHIRIFVSTVIGQFVETVSGFLLSAADPDAVVGYVNFEVRVEIDQAARSGRIKTDQYNQLLSMLNTSPVGAKVLLLQMQGIEKPAVLSNWNPSSPWSVTLKKTTDSQTDQPDTGRFSGTYTGPENSEMTIPQPAGYPPMVIAQPTHNITITISDGQARLGAITAPLDGVNGNHFTLSVSAASMGISVPGGVAMSLTYEGTISLTDDSIDGNISGASGMAPYIITTTGTFNLDKE